MATRKLQSKPVVISWDRGLPRLAQAASVALAVLTHTKLRSIGDLKAALEEGDERARRLMRDIRLPDEARQLLADSSIVPVLGLLRARTNTTDGRQHMLTVAVCPVCGEWNLVGGAGGPTRCLLRRDCPGRPVKAVPGSRRRVEETAADAVPSDPGVADADDPRWAGAGTESAAAQSGLVGSGVVDDPGPQWDRPGPDDGDEDPFG